MTSKTTKILATIGILFFIGGGLFWFVQYSQAQKNLGSQLKAEESYAFILASGITPALDPNYEFPTNFQYLNGCFGYAVGHVLQDRGHKDIDFLEMEQRIEKPRNVLWGKEEKNRLAQEYGLEFTWSKSAEKLLNLLASGESVVLSYKYPLGDGDWVLHAVAAYSFDDQGIWVSDTLSGKNIRIPYEDVFTQKGNELLYWFAQVAEK